MPGEEQQGKVIQERTWFTTGLVGEGRISRCWGGGDTSTCLCLLKDKALSLLLTGYSPEPRGTALPQPGGGPHHLLPQLLSSNHHLCPVVLLRGFLLQAAAQALHARLEAGGGGEMRPG